jgi:hypothetical protein
MFAGSGIASAAMALASGPSALHVSAKVTLPTDGNIVSLGSLFEVRTELGELVAHAGNTYATNTYYDLPTTELSFYVAASDAPAPEWSDMGKPFPEAFSETRLVTARGELYAVNKHLPAHTKNIARLEADGLWKRITREEAGGVPAWQGVVEACGGLIGFERLGITFNGAYIYDLPGEFFEMYGHFHNGQVLIYAMTAYASNAIMLGTYACGDTAITVTHRFADPVPHELQPRNFPYAWHFVEGGDALIATNLGFVYLARPRPSALVVLKSHDTNSSWQPYTFVNWFNETLVGQYPAGSVFAYAGAAKRPPVVPFEPAVAPEPGASSQAREAQTFAIYGGELLLGVWPWGAIHAKGPTRDAPWTTKRRLFATPPINGSVVAPWVDRPGLANKSLPNQWGQRVSGLKTFNGSLYATTSAKNPITGDLYRGLIPRASEAEYARVHKLSVANEASGRLQLKPGLASTSLEFVLSETGLQVHQDGALIASSPLPKPIHIAPGALHVRSCSGIYGACPNGVSVDAKLV